MANKVITVLLIDDHPIVHTGYSRLLETIPDINLVAAANDGERGCALFELHHPDVVIVDLNMPGIGGLETIRRIKTRNHDANILVFSMYHNKIMVQRSLEIGASGFISKRSDSGQLAKAIRLLSLGEAFIDPILAQDLYSDKALSHDGDNPLQILSKREFQLFRLLAEGNTCTQIANKISISPKTVGVHHANIMKKLKIKNAAQLVRLAIDCDVIQP